MAVRGAVFGGSWAFGRARRRAVYVTVASRSGGRRGFDEEPRGMGLVPLVAAGCGMADEGLRVEIVQVLFGVLDCGATVG